MMQIFKRKWLFLDISNLVLPVMELSWVKQDHMGFKVYECMNWSSPFLQDLIYKMFGQSYLN